MEDKVKMALHGIQEDLKRGAEGGIGIIFSGGMGSLLLAHLANTTIARSSFALVLIRSSLWSPRGIEHARRTAKETGCAVKEIWVDELQEEGIAENRNNRCYLCRKLHHRTIRAALPNGWNIWDPMTLDGLARHKFGSRACAEDQVLLPLADHGMDRRAAAKAMESLGIRLSPRDGAGCLARMAPEGMKLSEHAMRCLGTMAELAPRARRSFQILMPTPGTAVLVPLAPWIDPVWEDLRDGLLRGGFDRVMLEVTKASAPATGDLIQKVRILAERPFE